MSDLNGGNRINPLYSFASLAEAIKHPVQTVQRLFNWDVEEVGLFTMKQNIVEVDGQRQNHGPVPQVTHITNNEYVPVSGYKAIVRSGGIPGDEILHVAPNSYQIISNAQFEDVVADYLKQGCEYVRHGTFNNGRQIYVQLKCPGMLKPFLIGGTDAVDALMTIVSSHNGTLAYKNLLNMGRLFCNNQLAMLSRTPGASFVIKHTKSATKRIEDVQAQISAMGKLARQTVESFELLNATPISRWENEQFFADLFGMKKEIRISTINGKEVPSPEPVYSGKALNMLEALHEAYSHELQRDLGNTAWRLLNSVTYYVDHSPHIRDSRREKGYHMTGNGATIKYRAYTRLLTQAQSNGHSQGWEPSGLIQ